MPRYVPGAWVFGLVILFKRPYCAASRVPQGPSIARMRRMNRVAQVSCLVALLSPVLLFAQAPIKPLGPAPSDSPAGLRMPAPPIPDPPADLAPPGRPGSVLEAPPAPGVRAPLLATDDPFQQMPRDKAISDDL